MIAVIQRVKSSSVKVDGKVIGKIGNGINILLGVLRGDSKEDIEKLSQKIIELRIFEDENGKMNKSIMDVGGEILVISQFTLAGNIKKGRRPSFDSAEKPDIAKELYETFIEECSKYLKVESGVFGAYMDVNIQNDGPVTFIIDSKVIN